ncbi:hypothetical protein [Brevundimonas diminuta]|uniref:hypothetical protein n=1 Tax=Brevundimonas diminuta TaxID=293 RepID=UPI0030FC4263
MAPGGSSNCRDCDDCGYQECLTVGVCLSAQAQVMGVDASDLASARPVWIGVDFGGPAAAIGELAFLFPLSFPSFSETLEEFQRLFLVRLMSDQDNRSEGARHE